ncbi:unnamed protein product [Durusdinium trenchii]|uniref:Uncharacterized protein n=1 Tax=Durusdinium trenchii TaxID=1381693 RepID=A0ABP0JWN4_9DINO
MAEVGPQGCAENHVEAQGQNLILPLNSNVDGGAHSRVKFFSSDVCTGSQVALPGSPRSPEAVSEEERLRRIFGPTGLPPTPRPHRGAGWIFGFVWQARG